MVHEAYFVCSELLGVDRIRGDAAEFTIGGLLQSNEVKLAVFALVAAVAVGLALA